MTSPTDTPLNGSGRGSGDLPTGWRERYVASIGRPLVIGPGGVYVLFARDTVLAGDGAAHRAVPQARGDGDRRSASSGAQLTAEVVSQMLGHATGGDVACTPVVVIDDTAALAARPDLVPVLHRRRFAAWLDERPEVLAPADVERIMDALHIG